LSSQLPVREVLAAEEHDRVRGRLPVRGARCDHARPRPGDIVHAPFLPGKVGRIIVAKLAFVGRLSLCERPAGEQHQSKYSNIAKHGGSLLEPARLSEAVEPW